MRRQFILLFCLAPLAGFGANVDAALKGTLLFETFRTAPFPHPARAQGHKYHDEDFAAATHYSDSTVAIYIPSGFQPRNSQADVVVHFHGWRNEVARVLKRYRLPEQLEASQRNAILVVPQGPKNAPDSFDGKLEDSGGFKNFVDELEDVLKKKAGFGVLTVGHIILSGHSGGYQVMSSIVDHGGLAAPPAEVWLFDGLYARTDQFLAWQKTTGGRLLNIYTPNGGTRDESMAMMQRLRGEGRSFLAVSEDAMTAEQLRTNRLVFCASTLPHDEVLQAHDTFQKFLETSCLQARDRK